MSSETERTAKQGRRVRLWHVLVVAAVVLVGVVLGLRWHWVRGFRKRVEAIAAAGYPVTPRALDAWYAWPESGENAAGWIDEAGARLTLPKKGYDRLRELARNPVLHAHEDPLAEDLNSLLIEHVEANAEALDLLHQAATVGGGRYPIDSSEGFFTPLPHVSVYDQSHCLLCLEALLCMGRDDTDGAVRAIESALGIAGSLASEPIVLSQNLRLRSQRSVLAVLERLLCRQTLTEAQLGRLEAAVLETRAPDGVKRALVGDQCMLVDLFTRPGLIYEDSLRKSPHPAILEAYVGLGLGAREGNVFLDMIGEYRRIIELPTPRRVEAVKGVETEYNARLKHSVLWPKYPWTGMVVRLEIEGMARQRAATVALAIERFRLKMGRCPETLAELAPEYLPTLPEDPFDGALLRSRWLDGGYVVYSVGEDGVDDDGKERPPGEEDGETYDVTFMVLR